MEFKAGYLPEPLYHRAFLSVVSSAGRNVYAKPNWADSIRLSRTKWMSPSKNETGSTFILDRTSGSSVLKIDAGEAVPVLLNDNTNNTAVLISGKDINGHEISININIADGGILNFKPNNENYHERYSFDDALTMACQQSGDYEEREINGTKYYVPWLGMAPNTEAEIKLVYTSDKKINMDGYKIVLESEDNGLTIDGESDKEYSLFGSINVKVRATNPGSYYINAYLLNTSEMNKLQTGKLKVEVQPVKTLFNKIQIIRVRRSDEDTFPVVNKSLLINQINTLYRQSFLQFELDPADYRDTLTINQTKNDRIYLKNISIARKYENNIYYILILNEKGINSNSGEVNSPLNSKSNVNISILLGNTNEDVASHELGHNLGLLHTFEKETEALADYLILKHENRILPPKFSTRNIMDYIYQGTSSSHRRYFFKYQIDYLKNTKPILDEQL